MLLMRTLKILGLLAVLAALSGCATSWVVDSDVKSHSTLQGFAPGAGYRFERLPSQTDTEPARTAQADLEAMAAPALAAVGLRPDESPSLQLLGQQAHAVAVTPQQLDQVAAAAAEDEDMTT